MEWKYTLPDWEDIKKKVDNLDTVTSKINHLRRELVDLENGLDFPARGSYEYISYTPRSARIATSEKPLHPNPNHPDNLDPTHIRLKAQFEHNAKVIRRRLDREIALLLEQLPETIITQKQLEEVSGHAHFAPNHIGNSAKDLSTGVRGDEMYTVDNNCPTLPWHGPVLAFSNWLEATHERWIQGAYGPKFEQCSKKEFAEAMSALFFTVKDREIQGPINAATAYSHMSNSVSGAFVNEEIVKCSESGLDVDG